MIFWSWNLFLAFFISVVFAGVLVPVMLHSILSVNTCGSSAVSYIFRRAASRCGGISFDYFPHLSCFVAASCGGAAHSSGVYASRAGQGSFSFAAGGSVSGHVVCGDILMRN